ncbi:MAG TPA: IPT/TIG domain-containing protein [Candidatus Acidoferrales bacterium]
MLGAQSNYPSTSRSYSPGDAGKESGRHLRPVGHGKWGVALLALFLVPLIFAQNAAKVTALEPTSGKVNDDVTVTGENLGKDSVAAVFLSDAQDDFKATVVEQAEQKILMKIPQVKAGAYNLAIQVKDRIFILPFRFTVAE